MGCFSENFFPADVIKGKYKIQLKINLSKSSLIRLFGVRNDLLLVLDVLKYFGVNDTSSLEKFLGWSLSLWIVSKPCIAPKNPFKLLNQFTGAYSIAASSKTIKRKSLPNTEAVAQKCSVKKVFLEISQNLQGNTRARVSFLFKKFIKKETLAPVFSWGFCEISKNNFSYRTPLVAASANG